MSVRRANRLAGEKSPYLLQHAHNPVDWHPWDDEAFALARATDRPIFLSIGYATCHWCHVMERESFEDERVARVLNELFVPIKVDREERPDVDRVYMTAMQALGLGGGWPLNVFLTPDLAPFYGGTYFPPETRGGHPGMLDLLPRVAQAWRDERAALEENGARLFDALGRLETPEGAAAPFTGLCDAAWFHFERAADPEWGGFGRAPKFPTAANLAFLWRDAARVEASDPARAEHARKLALLQLSRMREGGIHDHLGGGFHRYSVDRQWLVPHFEKMLYDQAQLLDAYCDAYRGTGLAEWADTASRIAGYVTRDLSGAHGGYLSAEDADSEGEEGRFYVWRPSELAAVLGDEDAQRVAQRYGVTEQGNFEGGTSILHLADPSVAPMPDLEERLREFRSKRPRPLLDDKVITAWNGLMMAAMARASWILNDSVLEASAVRAGEFAISYLSKDGTLVRRWRDGGAGGEGQLDDYAFLAHGLIALHQATFDPKWLEHASILVDTMIERFADPAGGGFFESPEGDASIRVRMKDAFDGAELAGNSIAARVLLALAPLADRADYAGHAQKTLDAFARRIAEHPAAMPMMLVATMDAMAEARHIAIVAERDDDARAMIEAARAAASPRDLILLVKAANRERIAKLAPFVAPLEARDGKATAYVCVERACRAPTTDPAALTRELQS